MTRITSIWAMTTMILLISGCQPYGWYQVSYTSTTPRGTVKQQWVSTPVPQRKPLPPVRQAVPVPTSTPKVASVPAAVPLPDPRHNRETVRVVNEPKVAPAPAAASRVPNPQPNPETARVINELIGRVDEALVRAYWSPERLAPLVESVAKVDLKGAATADATRLWLGLGLMSYLNNDHPAADRFWSRVDRRVSDPKIVGSAWPWTPGAIERFSRSR